MVTSSRLAAATVLALLAPAAAFAAPPPGFTLTAQTPRMAFYGRGDARPDVRKLEGSLARIERTLGREAKGQAEYFRYPSVQELEAATGHYASGVTYASTGQIHSIDEDHQHELVHLVAGQVGNPGRFFQEGLAVVVGDGGRYQGKDVRKLVKRLEGQLPLRRAIGRFESVAADLAYPLAGAFVADLVKEHGMDRVMAFFAESGPQGKSRDAAFARAFGQSLGEAAEAWLGRYQAR